MAVFMRIRRRDLEDIEAVLDAALGIVERLKKTIEANFEESIRRGVLENMFNRLDELLELLLGYGFINVRHAYERSMLLARYAHAIQVRLRGRPEGSIALFREANDFKNHLEYIEQVLVEVREIINYIPRTRRAREDE